MQGDADARPGADLKATETARAAADDAGRPKPDQPQEALPQAQKMESLVRLTGGLALPL